MITSGPYPRLQDADPVYAFKTWADIMADRLESSGGWSNIAMGSGWTAVANYPCQVRRVGIEVYIRGMARWMSGSYTSPMLQPLPQSWRPAGQNEWLQPCIVGATRGMAQPMVTTTGLVQIPSGNQYITSNVTAGDLFVISGSWLI